MAEQATCYDIEAFRRGINRKMWVVIAASIATSLLALLVALAAVARPVPVIAFDAKGRAIVFDDTVNPALEVTEVRIEHFTGLFLQRFVGIDSSRLQLDLAEAVNMMTPQARQIALREGREVKRRLAYEHGNVRSRFVDLQVRIGDLEPQGSGDIYVVAWGKQLFEPIIAPPTADETIEQWFYAEVVLAQVDISRQTPYGLLVKRIDSRPFDDIQKLEAALLKRGPRS